MPPAVDPGRRAKAALGELRQLATPERAAGTRAYFKAYERVEVFGVSSPDVRRLAARIRRETSGWALDDAVRFADRLIGRPELESKGLGVCLLGRFRRQFDDRLLATCRRWLGESCHDWASTDTLCGEVIGPLLADRPHLVPKLRAWQSSRALYVRRASLVALVPLARRGLALDEAYRRVTALAGDREDLIQKAAGWLLREAGKTDPARLEAFLQKSGGGLGRTTVRYAIERFPRAQRMELLQATRFQSGRRAGLQSRQGGDGPTGRSNRRAPARPG